MTVDWMRLAMTNAMLCFATLMAAPFASTSFGFWSLIGSFALSAVTGAFAFLMTFGPEFYLDLGPIQILRCGRIWAFDVGRLRLFGIGWQMSVTTVRDDD